jgi:hypothetical protein
MFKSLILFRRSTTPAADDAKESLIARAEFFCFGASTLHSLFGSSCHEGDGTLAGRFRSRLKIVSE